MPVIALISQKGGAGKSTVAVHLAALAWADGLDVLLVDLDPQESAWRWNESRDPERRLPASRQLPAKPSQRLIIVDTPPHSDAVAALAAQAADLIIAPCRPAKFDLDAMASTSRLLKVARKPSFAVINHVAHNAGASLVGEVRAGLAGLGVEAAPVVLVQRVDFSHALIGGDGVHEYAPGGKADLEIRALYRWVLEQVGLNDGGK